MDFPRYIGEYKGMGKIIRASLKDKLMDEYRDRNLYLRVKSGDDVVTVYYKYMIKEGYDVSPLLNKLINKSVSFEGPAYLLAPGVIYINSKPKLIKYDTGVCEEING